MMSKYEQLLKAMKKDEKYAPSDYLKLLKQIKDVRSRKLIMSIIQDERKHGRLLKRVRQK